MHLFIDKLNLSMDTWRDKFEQKNHSYFTYGLEEEYQDNPKIGRDHEVKAWECLKKLFLWEREMISLLIFRWKFIDERVWKLLFLAPFQQFWGF